MNTGQNVITINGETFYQVAERFETSGTTPVFDLEVSGEHTYAVGGIGVHNSLKGFDEYARLFLRARYERPIQGLWFLHPSMGVTSVKPIYLDDMQRAAPVDSWVAWAA